MDGGDDCEDGIVTCELHFCGYKGLSRIEFSVRDFFLLFFLPQVRLKKGDLQ